MKITKHFLDEDPPHTPSITFFLHIFFYVHIFININNQITFSHTAAPFTYICTLRAVVCKNILKNDIENPDLPSF